MCDVGQSLDRNTVLLAQSVSKKFCKDMRRSMKYGIFELAANMAGVGPKLDKLRKSEFWAIEDVDLELKRGEVLGLLGHNGSGKSTLLRLLAGILPLDKGRITHRGRVSALIALGAGFHPHLTARENVFLNGTILGMTRRDVRRNFDDIIEFAEIADFVDAPLATFSSGMRVRLGFAIAVHANPRILLVDEVLAVGDVGFRAKCYQHITRLLDDSGIILVTHSMPHVARYCDRVILLESGSISFSGPTREGIERYLDHFDTKEGGTVLIGDEENSVVTFDVTGDPGDVSSVAYGGTLNVDVSLRVARSEPHPIVKVTVHSRDMQVITASKTAPGSITNVDGRVSVRLALGPLYLRKGHYRISLTVHDSAERRHLIWNNGCWGFDVVDGPDEADASVVFFAGEWTQR